MRDLIDALETFMKREIFGLSAAHLYKIDPEGVRCTAAAREPATLRTPAAGGAP